jgi:hypothetical protein
MLKFFISLVTGTAALTTMALGQTGVTAKVKANQNPMIANSYMRADVRHYTTQSYNAENEVVSIKPRVETRLQIGTLLLNEKLDILYSMNFQKVPLNGKKSHEDTAKMLQPWIWAEYHLIEGAVGTAGPYVFMAPKFGDSVESGNVGAYYYSPSSDINVGIGALKLYGEGYGSVAYDHSDNKKDVAVKKNDLGLASQAAPTTEERHQAYELNSVGLLELKLAAVKGLSTGADADWLASYTPKYSLVEDSESDSELDGYATSARTRTSMFVKYKVSDKMSVSNKVSVDHDGFYKDVKDTNRYINRVQLLYTFF